MFIEKQYEAASSGVDLWNKQGLSITLAYQMLKQQFEDLSDQR